MVVLGKLLELNDNLRKGQYFIDKIHEETNNLYIFKQFYGALKQASQKIQKHKEWWRGGRWKIICTHSCKVDTQMNELKFTLGIYAFHIIS